MASQPLETIPKEPTPAPTPLNSLTPARVTADPPKTKPKHPGRVASGKRLAERNRLAREAQKKAEAEAASPAPDTASENNTTEEASGSSGLSLVTVLGIGGLIVVLPARGHHGKAQTCPTGTTRTASGTGTVSHSSKTRY